MIMLRGSESQNGNYPDHKVFNSVKVVWLQRTNVVFFNSVFIIYSERMGIAMVIIPS